MEHVIEGVLVDLDAGTAKGIRIKDTLGHDRVALSEHHGDGWQIG